VQGDTDTVSVFVNRSQTWSTLGYALPPSAGAAAPLLVGGGTPAADELVTLEASGTQLGPAVAGVLIVGVDAEFTPFHDGILVPAVDITAPIETSRPLTGRWPHGIPAGTPVYLQALFATPGGETVATNALVVIAQ
jgi:hypothetical protein